MRFTLNKFALATVVSTLIAACSGGGGGGDDGGAPPPAPQQLSGQFHDSLVEGLRWESGDLGGYTDAAGTFEYMFLNSADTVTFYVGDIRLGSTPGRKIVIPVDLVGSGNIDNPTVLNIARFLLSLDEDGDPANGILITRPLSDQTSGESVDFTLSTDAFTSSYQTLVNSLSAINGEARDLVSAAYAREHLRQTISLLLSGTYEGTYSGDGEGTWRGTINGNGDFNGTAFPQGGGEIPMFKEQAVSGDGTGEAGFEATGGAIGERVISFSGTFSTDGNASGTWEEEAEVISRGSWRGEKTQP